MAEERVEELVEELDEYEVELLLRPAAECATSTMSRSARSTLPEPRIVAQDDVMENV